MINQRKLYKYNQHRIHDLANHNQSYLSYEKAWINDILQNLDKGEHISSYNDLIAQFDDFIAGESIMESTSADYISLHMPLSDFRVFLQEFAIDGLTEAQVFYYIMPRLHLQAQMPMLRILIDEFGSANPQKMHTALFTTLLQELDMSVSEADYIDRIDDISYEFVNQYYWLTLRADDPSFFVGALAYLETMIPVLFPCLVEACKRLGIKSHHYYSEHCHIDEFHALETKKILRAMVNTNTLNCKKAWLGAQLSSYLTNRVFDNAVAIAQISGKSSAWVNHQMEQRV